MSSSTTPPDLDGFTYVEELGTGGQATVFKYAQPAFSRMVAVKVLNGRLGPSTQRAFEAETRTMGQLSAHPNVVSIYQAGITASQSAYFVMEFCPPPNLSVRVRRQRRPYGVPEALKTGVQIAGAVERAHSLGILHRDIKPANILVNEYGTPKLTDFGIATSLTGDALSAAEGVTVPWAPPEQQMAGARLTPAADVYSLAATLWTLLAGRSPFEVVGGDNDVQALRRRIRSDPAPRVRRDDVPETLDRVLQQALEKQPEQRFRSAADFARALQRVEVELHLPPTPFTGGQIAYDDASDGDEERGSTRFVVYVPIDPDGPGSTRNQPRQTAASSTRPDLTNLHAQWAPTPAPGPDFIADGRGTAPVGIRDFTGPRLPTHELERTDLIPDRQVPPAPAPGAAPVEPAPAGRSSGRVVAIVAVAVLALIAILVSLTGLLGGTGSGAAASSSTTTSSPQDPVGETIPPVSGVTLTPTGKKLQVTWTDTAPLAGDTFLYRAYHPGAAVPDYAPVPATLPLSIAAADAPFCVQVVRVRSYHQSDAAEGCM